MKNKQVDINNFVGKFLNDGMMENAAGYHKGLFAAMNPDAIAKHFYEQGKSDAIKTSVAESKNINTSRESHKVYEGEGGIKFKVLGDDSSDSVADAVSGLIALGYKPQNASKYVRQIETKGLTSEGIIREVLRALASR